MLKVKSILLTIFSFFIPFITFAQETVETAELTLDQKIDAGFKPFSDAVSSVIFYSLNFGQYSVPLVIIILIAGAIFFTVYFKFANFTLIGTAVKVLKGDYDELDHHGSDIAEGDSTPGGDVFETMGSEGVEGEVSHFQALTAALSATVGLGNIAGVAVAVAIGGPGATFWMILAGFLGMATKFVECTLGVKYREVTEDGTVHGGPMYYLSKGLKEKGMG
ncbi:MAG: alanine:cation symporter family protein, partial [Flavobacteriales bacterium]